MGSLYKRGNTWWISYYVNRKQVRESSCTHDRELAELYLQYRVRGLKYEKLIKVIESKMKSEMISFETLQEARRRVKMQRVVFTCDRCKKEELGATNARGAGQYRRIYPPPGWQKIDGFDICGGCIESLIVDLTKETEQEV